MAQNIAFTVSKSSEEAETRELFFFITNSPLHGPNTLVHFF